MDEPVLRGVVSRAGDYRVSRPEEGSMMKSVKTKTSSEPLRFDLMAGNGQVVATSDSYTARHQ
jgi:hypothetical protein